MRLHLLICLVGLLLSTAALPAERQMEALGLGVVALRLDPNRVYVSWRLLSTDPDELALVEIYDVGL